MAVTLVSTPQALAACLTSILPGSEAVPPTFYMDLEGRNLSMRGTISIVTILSSASPTVYLIDICTLKQQAFDYEDHRSISLRRLLESPQYAKVFFDVRRDSEALFHLYAVKLLNVIDLQLLQLATRTYSRAFLVGLAKCIETDANMTVAQRMQWKAVKDAGRSMYDASKGGNPAAFDERPMKKAIEDYCAQDVLHMPKLHQLYEARLSPQWRPVVQAETVARIAASQSPVFDSDGKHRAIAPAAFQKQPAPSNSLQASSFV